MKKIQNIVRFASLLFIGVALSLSSCGGGSEKEEPTPPSPSLQAINIQGNTTELIVGQKVQLTASASPTSVTLSTITWTSSNGAVATVTNAGLVTAIGAGSTTIKATAQGKTDTYQISVSPKPVEVIHAESVELQEAVTIEIGKSKQLEATVSPSDATNKTITWKSSAPSIATVSKDGLVEALTTGSATITATVKNTDDSEASSSCEVEVIKYATGLSLNKATITMEVTETAYLYATVLPNDATYNSVSFSSSNESIATIDRSGKITPIKVGTIIITATLDNGARGTLEADCTLEILPETIFATDFSINPANPTVEYQGTVQLQAIITPSNASFQHVTWKCDNTTIATVDSNGLVTAHSAGQATITATLTNGTKPNIVKTTTITVNENSSGDGDGISDNGELDEVGTN